MLTLGRRIDERLVLIIPPSATETIVEICLCDIRGDDAARIGVEAPREVTILRKEVLERELAAARAAAGRPT